MHSFEENASEKGGKSFVEGDLLESFTRAIIDGDFSEHLALVLSISQITVHPPSS